MASILHIGYYRSLVEARKIMLENDGYEVVNALGNDEAMHFASTRPFDLVVLGFSTTSSIRRAMIHWLKQHVSQTPVVALLAHEHEHFPEADCESLSEDPRLWLASIADCINRH